MASHPHCFQSIHRQVDRMLCYTGTTAYISQQEGRFSLFNMQMRKGVQIRGSESRTDDSLCGWCTRHPDRAQATLLPWATYAHA